MTICICQTCGKEFKKHTYLVKKGYGKYCCRECAHKGQVKQVTLTCQECGKEFKVPPSRIKQSEVKFCCKQCESNYRQRQQKIKKYCKHCGKPLYTYNRTYCSNECLRAHKTAEKTCPICGKTFAVPKNKVNKIHLCPECYKKGHKVKEIRPLSGVEVACPTCGKIFRIDNTRHKLYKKKFYCCRDCYEHRGCTPNEIKEYEDRAEIVITKKDGTTLYGIIDLDDLDKVKDKRWIVDQENYVVSTGKSRERLHRLVTNCPDGFVPDHVNHNPLDNRKSNLRITTIRGNTLNRQLSSKNKSGVTGVLQKKDGKWEAYFCGTFLGSFKTLKEATVARVDAELADTDHLRKVIDPS